MNLKEYIECCGEEADHHRMEMKKLYESAFKSWLEDYEQEPSKEPRVIELKNLGLTADDGFFIWAYTGSSSSWLNSEKRNGNDHESACKKLFADYLEAALRKLPMYVGIAYRWEEADDELRKFNWFKNNIGLKVSVPYFLSTSKDDITADPMIWKIQTIEDGNARDVSEISNAPCEQEILFIPNAKFRIAGVKDDNKTVFLEELSQDEETNFELCRVYYRDPDDIDPDMLEPGIFD